MSELAQLVWVTAWYDGPVNGLARRDGELAWFSGDPYAQRWTLYRLTADDAARLLADQARFEQLVGTHWSFDVPVDERAQRPRDLQRAYFAGVDADARPAFRASLSCPSRQITQIEAWAPYRR